jgi:hypothetical protein
MDMLKGLLGVLMEQEEQKKQCEMYMKRAGVEEVERDIAEVTSKYPNTKSARRMVSSCTEDIPKDISAAMEVLQLLEPSQKLVMLKYVAAQLKMALYQLEDMQEEILNPKPETDADKKEV